MKMQIEIPIKDWVKSRMKSKGFNQKRLAQLSGVTPAAISFYCSGARATITVTTLEKIIRVLK